MRIGDLPIRPAASDGESVRSWLNRVRLELGLEESEWWLWCGLSASETERRADGQQWQDLPPGIGSISRIPPFWRIDPEWRDVVCPCCFIEGRAGARYPTLVSWLDVRVIACSEHRLLLYHRANIAKISIDLERDLQDLDQWLEEWRMGKCSRMGARLRRDLVMAAGRNWSSHYDVVACAELAWELAQLGLPLSSRTRRYQAGRPSRVGQMIPGERLAALISAFRAWDALNGRNFDRLPRWPLLAWAWLNQRWGDRAHENSGRIRGIVRSMLSESRSAQRRLHTRRTNRRRD